MKYEVIGIKNFEREEVSFLVYEKGKGHQVKKELKKDILRIYEEKIKLLMEDESIRSTNLEVLLK